MDDNMEIMRNETALVPIAALSANIEYVKQVLAENNESGGITEMDLPRIKVPTGGHLAFAVTNFDGTVYVPTFRAVILWSRKVRTYWATGIDEGGVSGPPDCFSPDDSQGVGYGTPGGVCAICPMNQFGSARGKNGRPGHGKACAESMRVFLLREHTGNFLPEILVVPATSLIPFRAYNKSFLGFPIRIYGVMTEIGLRQAKNADGVVFSQTTFKRMEVFSPETAARFREFEEYYHKVFAPRQIINANTITAVPQQQTISDEDKVF